MVKKQVMQLSLSIAVVATLAAAYGLSRYYPRTPSEGAEKRKVLYYVDPMHPSYKSDTPGIAPDCGMELQPVFAENVGDGKAAGSDSHVHAGLVHIDAATQRLIGIRVAAVGRSGNTSFVRVVGRVVPEDTRVYSINSGVDGFFRGTYNDSVGMLVKKDQKLATYYSPDFLAVASGFLAASERVPGSIGGDGAKSVPFPGAVAKQGVSSLQGYTDRLRNLGMSDVQIQEMKDNRQLPQSIDVVSPVDGFILARNISAGQHFERNMEFYRIADLSRVWVVAEVFEPMAANLRPGVTARIILKDAGRQLSARVTDSLPQSEAGGGTVKVRLELDNPQLMMRPDMLVDVDFPVLLPSAITVPVDALIESGVHARVYVEHGEGTYEPREVETGWRYGESVEIRHGLRPGERVVTSAAFLVDSESRLTATDSRPVLPYSVYPMDQGPGLLGGGRTMNDHMRPDDDSGQDGTMRHHLHASIDTTQSVAQPTDVNALVETAPQLAQKAAGNRQ